MLKFFAYQAQLGKRLLKEKGRSKLHISFMILFGLVLFVLLILMRYAHFIKTTSLVLLIGLFVLERFLLYLNDFSLFENGIICAQGVIFKKNILKAMWIESKHHQNHLQLEVRVGKYRRLFVTQKISENHENQINAYFNIHRYD
ncbi:MAG: hypothetical protein JXR88_04945 [Clostridia bacterium]|nr:hypothetical protein [Clostridia bacterium]